MPALGTASTTSAAAAADARRNPAANNNGTNGGIEEVPATAAGGETYIENGRVVHGTRPTSIVDYVTHAFNLTVFFFTSIVSSEPVRQQIDTFNGSRRRNYGGSSNTNNSSRGVGGKGNDGKKSNVNTFGPAAQTGCHGGG